MAGTTTRYQFPYPSPSDNNNVPADMQSLATAVDTKLGVVANESVVDQVQPGVVTGGTCTKLSATSVRIAAGTAWVRDSATLMRRVTWTQTDLTVPAASGTNKRVDQVIVRATATAPERLAGTESSTATIDNRTNAGALPSDALLLHDLVQTSDGALIGTSAGQRDRRPRAAGLRHQVIRTSATGATTNAVGDANAASLFTGAFDFRMEATGSNLVEIGIDARASINAAGPSYWLLLKDNGVYVREFDLQSGFNSVRIALVPSAGTHLYSWHHFVGQTGTSGLDVYTSGGGGRAYGWAIEHLGSVGNNGTT